MYKETLINDSIVASISVDCLKRGDDPDVERSEFDRISAMLQTICNSRTDQVFIIYGRAHRVTRPGPIYDSTSTLWMPHVGGGGKAQIVLALMDQPCQRIFLSYKLVRGGETQGQLTAEFNPTTILSGNNVHPASIADPETGEICAFPSSAPRVMKQVYRLGFDLLEDLWQSANTKEPLFHPVTRAAIQHGDIHIVRAQWCAYFPTVDVPLFLKTIGACFGHTISRDKGLIQVADHLGLEAKIYNEDGFVTGVMLTKKYGKKPLFSLVFYNKRKRVADMKQSKSLLPAELSTVHQNVRYDITAHSAEIIAIVEAARGRLTSLRNDFPNFFDASREEFCKGEPKSDVRSLERAIFILSHTFSGRLLVRRSFAGWLVPYMIDHVLRLKLIAGFSRQNLNQLLANRDEVAVAWRDDEASELDAWAPRLAKKARCSQQTVYSRRRTWLDEYGVDIALPYALYRDLLYFGQHSLTLPGNRSALLATEQTQNGTEAVRLLQNAAKVFDQRRGAVHATISSPLHAMEIKVARTRILNRSALTPRVLMVKPSSA